MFDILRERSFEADFDEVSTRWLGVSASAQVRMYFVVRVRTRIIRGLQCVGKSQWVKCGDISMEIHHTFYLP